MTAPKPRICQICGDPLLRGKTGVTKYCTPCGITMARRRGRVSTAAAPPVEHRQPPPKRARFVLEWHPQIVIGPDMPARVRRYTNGRPTPFQDDLNALANHGSNAALGHPTPCLRSYTGCAADMLVGVA